MFLSTATYRCRHLSANGGSKVVHLVLSDVNMQLFIEECIRGGIVECSLCHVKANNQYLNDYCKDNETSYLLYLDMNKNIWVSND